MNKAKSCLILTAILLAAMAIVVVPVSAKTSWTVDDNLVEFPSADFTTIQDALAAAGPRDVILVYPGDYYGPVEITKQGVKLMSTDGASVTTVHQGSWPFLVGGQLVTWWYVGIAVLVDDVTVKGFTVTDDAAGVHFNSPGIIVGDHRGPFGGPGYTPTFAQPVRNCMIQGNILDHNDFGIYFFNAQDGNIVNNVVKNSIDYGGMGQGGIGIIFWDDGYLSPGNVNNKIVDNEIFGNQRFGISIGTWNPPRTANCAGTKVHGNYVHDNTRNVGVYYAVGPIRITGNDLAGTQPSVYMSTKVFVAGNT